MRLGRWFRGWLGQDAPVAVAPVAIAAAPRLWHDEIAHDALPHLLLTEAHEVLAGDVPAQGRLDLLYDLFEDVGGRSGLEFDDAMDAADQARFLRRDAGPVRVAVIVMPPPLTAGEAHFVGLSAAPGLAPRCLALDRAEHGTALVRLDAEGHRDALGAGPRPDLDAFIAALAAP